MNPELDINRTKVDAFIPEKVANYAINKLSGYLNLGRTVYRDFENEVREEGDSVRVPKFGTLNANEMSATGSVTKQNPADDDVTVTLDQHWEVTFLLRNVAQAMAKPMVLDGYVKNGIIALAEKIENTLAALYAEAGDTVVVSGAMDKDDIRSARHKLVQAKLPRLAPKYVYLGDDGYNDLLGDTTVADASKFGSRSPLITGDVPQLWGFGIFETQNEVATGSPAVHHGLAYGEEAMALVMRPLPDPSALAGAQLGVRSAVVADEELGIGMRVLYSWDKDSLGIQVTLDALWGVGVLRPEHLIDIQHTPAS